MKTLLLKYRKPLLWALLALVVFFIVRRNWWRVKALIAPRLINTENGKTTVTPSREPYLQALANKIHSDIYNTPLSGHSEGIYKEADVLSDVELLYLSRYYKRSLTLGTSIYEDLSNEWFSIFGSTYDAVNSLTNHLAKIGER